jgi:hypothetical protein
LLHVLWSARINFNLYIAPHGFFCNWELNILGMITRVFFFSFNIPEMVYFSFLFQDQPNEVVAAQVVKGCPTIRCSPKKCREFVDTLSSELKHMIDLMGLVVCFLLSQNLLTGIYSCG